MGMSRAAKMVMTNYRSRNENNRAEGNRNESNRGEMNRSEMYGEGYSEGYGNRSEGNNISEGNNMEMRRRRDSRGRFMQAEGYEDRGYQNEGMEGYRNESSRYRNEGYRDEPERRPLDGRYEAENRMEGHEEYPKPYLLPRAIGFHGSDKSDQKGHSEHQRKELDQRTAQEWTQKMESEDGSKGPHWSIEQVKPLMMQVKFTGNPLEFWAIMNALYSDYCSVADKYGVSHPEFFAELTKAWLEDKDAVPNKAATYYDCIVKH